MAQKCASETFEEIISSKVSKLREESDCDVILDSVSVSADLKTSLEYDSVLKTFSISLDKERKDGNRFICVGEEEMNNIVKLLPVVEELARRYSSKRSPQIIDIPFEACSGGIGEVVTLVSLKENTFKRGHFDVDIRKSVKKEDSYQYTSEGVRFEQTLSCKLRETLLGYQTVIARATQKSREFISMTMARSITRHIQELSDTQNHCHGCQIDHPSQKEHMGYGGCLPEQEPTWEDAVSQYWQAGKSLVMEDDVLTLAKQAASLIPELQKVFIPGLVSPNGIPDHVLKEQVLRRGETEDSQMFKIVSNI